MNDTLKTSYIIGLLILFCNSIFAKVTNSEKPKLEVELNIIERNDNLILTASNNFIIPIELVIYNRSDNSVKNEYLIEPNSKVKLLTFDIQDKKALSDQLNEEYKIKYYYGDQSKILHNDKFLYRLPFNEGKKYRVSQSQNGKFTHNTKKSRYAIDFQLDIGDQVHAAREGIVIRTVDEFKEHGGIEFIKKANLIIIKHDDGTLGSYIHLDYKGVLVKVGDKIERGQLIGYSGLTGFTRGPHLHFVVHKHKNISVPIFFEGYEKQVLKKRKKYQIIN